jgi:ABC-type sugar transport system permease subunit
MFLSFHKFKRFLTFIKLLRIEFFILLFTFCFSMRKTPLDQLIQDKLCRHKYNLSQDFCTNLPEMKKDHKFYEFKSQILSDAVQYNMYHTLITTCPAIVWSLFYGAWIDNYKHGRKVIFLICSITAALESFMDAINAYFFYLSEYSIIH